MISLSIVIPTKGREDEIVECVGSIAKQVVKPNEVLIIDDGQISGAIKEKIKQLLSENDIFFKYFKKINPSSAESKNLGVKESNGQIILFLDDDVVLEDGYIKNLLKIWAERWSEKKLAGVSGVIINSRKKSFAEIIFNKIFLLCSAKTWAILPWGFQTWDYHIKKDELADWVPCGIASFRREIFDVYQFKSLQPGRVALEDIEFSWQLKDNNYYFIVTPSAKLIHKESTIGRESGFISGFKEGVARKIIFKTYAKKSFKNRFYFCISSFGWIIRQFLGGHYNRGFGMIKGYLQNNQNNARQNY